MDMNWKTNREVLTPEEEVRLFSLYQETKDEKYRIIIEESNIRLLFEFSKDYKRFAENYDDMIAYSYEGLREAIDEFDLSKGFRFNTFARSRIKKYVFKYLAENSPYLRIPPNQYKDAMKIKRLTDENEDLTNREIAEKLGIKLNLVKRLRGNVHPLISKDIRGSPLERILGKYEKNNDKKDLINHLLSRVDKRKKEIIERLYGLNGYKEHTSIKIAEIMNLTSTRIRQLRDEAYESMKISFYKENLEKCDVF